MPHELRERIESLNRDVRLILGEMGPLIDSASKLQWDRPTMGYLPLIRRAILCRQHEFLESICHLAEQERGYAAVPMLRPACEELIWAKYLCLIDEASANDLLLCLAQKEMHDSLAAQDGYLGRDGTISLGLFDHLKRLGEHQPTLHAQLSLLGRVLGWPERFVQHGAIPSIRWIAKTTQMSSMYKYLYHATSRYVHFSVGELLRRAWGTPDEITIRSHNFSEYWTAFALAWGLKLLTDTFLALQESLSKDGVIDPDIDGDKIIEAYKRTAEFGLVPIITKAELHWP
jgi:hypothetical protein